jgi:DNA polymerase elongation subunit (family B)
VEVEHDENTFRLIRITSIEEDTTCTPPPFSILYFDIRRDFDSNQISQIRARYEEEQDVSFEGEEESILTKFHEYFVNKDPDILIFSRDNYNSAFFYDLITKMNALGFDIGRELSIFRITNKASVKGRGYLESKSSYTDLDLAGLIERARFGFLPLGIAAHYGINRLIDSRNCQTLIWKGFVIQTNHSLVHEPIWTLEEINAKDKAGMIFSPTVGLHENVVVLDYENEYANLIIKNNLSPETISGSSSNHINRMEQGLLPTVLENVLKRRMYFKKLQRSFPANSSEWFWCQGSELMH